MKRTWKVYSILFLAIFLCDRLIKMWVMSTAFNEMRITSWFTIARTVNRGVSFSLFSFGSTPYYALISLIVLGLWFVLFCYAYSRWRDGHDVVAETVVLAGAFSNLVDRAWYGGVVDYLEISYGAWQWPAFNLADMFIVVGLFVMCIKGWHEE